MTKDPLRVLPTPSRFGYVRPMSSSRLATTDPALPAFIGIVLFCLGFTSVLGTTVAMGGPGEVLAGSHGSLARVTLVGGVLVLGLAVSSLVVAFRAQRLSR
jgi:hypothetical protein